MHRGRLAFVATMVSLVLLATLQTFIPVVKIRALEEFRSPAPFPDIVEKIRHGDGRIAADVNAWFDDRMGFRSFLTRLANQIDYTFFGFSRKVLIGKNGWLFDPTVFQAAVDDARSSDGLVTERNKLAAIAEFLRRRGIRLVIVSTPAKERVYREFLPDNVPQGPAVSEFEKFRAYLKSGDGRDWMHIDSQDIFEAAKKRNIDFYFHTDLHATAFGSFIVAQELVNRLAEAEGADWRWTGDLDLVPSKLYLGSNARFLAVLSVRFEPSLEPRPAFVYSQDNPSPGGFYDKSPPDPYEAIFHSNSDRPTLPRTVLFGSSFVDRYEMVGAFSYFKDVYRVRGKSSDIGRALKAIPPDTRYFIYQFWEPHLSTIREAEIPE